MSVGWVLAGVLLGVAGWRGLAGYPRPSIPPRVLTRAEWSTLDAVAEALFPAGGPVPPSGREAGVAAYVDRLVEASHPRQRWLMRALFVLVEHGTLLFPAPGLPSGWRRFSSLRPVQRVAVLEAWRRSGWFVRRLVFTSLRAICTMAYFSDPAVLRPLRLAPYAIDTPVVEADLWYPRVGEDRSSIRWTPSDLTGGDPARPLVPDDPLAPGFAEERR
jgi:hypothetical protein